MTEPRAPGPIGTPLPMLDGGRAGGGCAKRALTTGSAHDAASDRATGALRPSRYNVLFEEDGDAFLFNTRRGSFLRVAGRSAESLSWLARPRQVHMGPDDEPRPIERPQLEGDPLLPALLEGDFVIPAEIDELAMLQAANRLARFSRDSVSLTILTTLGCNLDCTYCYEDKHKGVMPVEVQDAIVTFVRGELRAARSLGVTWFGGEPLIGLRAIERLSAAFVEAAEESGAVYGADIITNGYLLDRSVAERLACWRVSAAQITLDGLGEVHDRRRPRLTGKPSFERILRNVESTWDLLDITIRMNLDRENVGGARDLVDHLAGRGLQERVTLSFAPVHAEGKGCRDRGDVGNPSLFSLEEIAQIQIDLNAYAYERGFGCMAPATSRPHACCADKSQGFVIEPDGTLQKCWQTVSDPTEAIGDVFAGAEMGPNLLKWLTYDPFREGFKCRSCKVLPQCMGWCPQKVMSDPSPESCNHIKHTIVEDLKLYHRGSRALRAGMRESQAGCGTG